MLASEVSRELREQARGHHIRIKSRLGLFIRQSSLLRFGEEGLFHFNSDFVTYCANPMSMQTFSKKL
jgi:hypothetical protein